MVSKLIYLKDINRPVYMQPVYADNLLWLYPLTYEENNDPVVKSFLNQIDGDYEEVYRFIENITKDFGQWCNWKDAVQDRFGRVSNRIILNIDWFIKKCALKNLSDKNGLTKSLMKVTRKHMNYWRKSGAEYISLGDKIIQRQCINNFTIPTEFVL